MHVFLLIILAMSLGACSMFGYNAGVKEPPYALLKEDGIFQVREYASLVLATTTSEGEFGKSQDESFQRLFDYISGNNTGNQNVSMTAPVLMQPQPTEIPMTAPVLMEPGKDKNWKMSFVLPADVTIENAPRPNDPLVQIEEKKNLRFAVVSFSGLFSDQNFTHHAKTLAAWIETQGLEAKGPAIRAGYNPPWTLPPLRRNEILIPVNR